MFSSSFINNRQTQEEEEEEEENQFLEHLLDKYQKDKKDTAENIIKFVQSNPSSAAKMIFTATQLSWLYPLFLALEKGASFDVVNALYRAYPEAVTSLDYHGNTALHYACEYGASLDVVSLLLDKNPSALSFQRKLGETPFCVLCSKCSSSSSSLEVVSFILEGYPEVAKAKDLFGNLPLHIACMHDSSIGMLTLLLETHPSAVHIKKFHNIIPTGWWDENDDRHMVIHNMKRLVNNNNNDGDNKNNNTAVVDIASAKQILKDFVQIGWQGGVVLVLDLYPSLVETFEVIVMPKILFVMCSRCKILTVWKMLRNWQDILKIN